MYNLVVSTTSPPAMPDHLITDLAALEALYGPVATPSLAKEADHLHPVYARWAAQARFAVLATNGAHGLDLSPRGDADPLLRILDERTVLLPERRGNNRIDSLRNLVADPRMSLMLLIPGVGEALRLRGRAAISVDPALLDSFAVKGQRPHCVLRISVETVFFQCARAVLRSRLWHTGEHDTSGVPTAGQMLAALTQDAIDGAAYDSALPQRQRDTLY